MKFRSFTLASLAVTAGISAQAATFTVTNTSDSGAGSLRQAILDANAAAGADTVIFDTAGVFALPQAIVLNSPLVVSGNLTIDAPEPTVNRVALRGNAAGTRIFSLSGSSVTLNINDLAVEDAWAKGATPNGGVASAGAGMSVTLNCERCIFDDCKADGRGALFHFVGAIATFTDCTFTDNSADAATLIHVDGGTITFHGGTAARNEHTGISTGTGGLIGMIRGSLTMENFDVSNSTIGNLAQSKLIGVGEYTGYVDTRGIVTISMTECNFTNNESTLIESDGGPITVADCTFDHSGDLIDASYFEDAVTLRDSTFTHNGFLVTATGPVTVEDCVMENNEGAIVSSGSVTLRRVKYRQNDAMPVSRASTGLVAEDCEFDGNTGKFGADEWAIRDLTLRRCAFTSNVGTNSAREIPGLVAENTQCWLEASDLIMESCLVHGNEGVLAVETAKLFNGTFSNNSGQSVITAKEELIVQNSVFVANTVTNAAGVVFETLDGAESNGGNFIDRTNAIDWADSHASDQIGTLAAPLDPLLGPLANWGGVGKSRMPLAGSPLINAGVVVPAAPDYQEPILDQSRQVRIIGASVDIGAVEARKEFIVTNINSSGVGSLRRAISDATGLENPVIMFDPVVFATPQTIVLSSPLNISTTVTIRAPSVGVALSGDDLERILNITGSNPLITIERVQFSKGYVVGDGAAVNMNTGSGGKLLLRECLFSQNFCTGDGGALWVGGGTVQAANCLFTNNHAVDTGGGMAVFGPGAAQVTNCTLSGNFSDRGGAGLVTDGGQATLINCTVANNMADADGSDDGNGGGLRVIGTATPLRLGNTVVANNTDASGGGGAVIHPDISGAFTTLGHNFIGKTDGQSAGAGTPVVSGTAGDQAGTIAVPLQADLAALAQNGGLFRSQRPNNGSPLVNSGNAALLNDPAWPETPLFDTRYQFRTVGAAPDIGAVEAADQIYIQFFAETVLNTVAEGQPGSEGRYVLRRSMPGTAVDVVLARGAASTASAADFALGGPSVWSLSAGFWQARFSATEMEKVVLLTPVDDLFVEADETASVFVFPTLSYIAQTAPVAERTTTIQSNDTVVTNTNDSGAGSLRAVLAAASPFAHTSIVFDSTVFSQPRTITLLTPLIHGTTSRHPSIHGPPHALTLSGNGVGRLLHTYADLTLENLNIANGLGVAPAGSDPAGIPALMADGGGELTLRGCCIRNCRSLGSGGAVVVGPTSSLVAENCTFSQNEAPIHGGAIYAWHDSRVTLTHCTLAENHADSDLSGFGEGGAIYLSPVDQFSSTHGHLTIQGCLVALNTDQIVHPETPSPLPHDIALPNTNPESALTNNGGNFFSTAFDQGFVVGKDVLAPQSQWTPNAAGLVLPLAFNGGPTMTYALRSDGLARLVSNPSWLSTDQRGLRRDYVSDAGAYHLGIEPYAFWAGYSLPAGETQTNPYDDSDGDGAVNLLEQYTGTDPASAASFPRAQIQVQTFVPVDPSQPSEHKVTLHYPLSPSIDWFNLRVERSTSLQTWEDITVAPAGAVIIDGLEHIPLEFYPPAVLATNDLRRFDPAAFFRLRTAAP